MLLGRRAQVVVNDPVTGRLYHFGLREFEILSALEHHSDLAGLLQTLRRKHPDEILQSDTLIHFLAESRKNGLLIREGGDSTSADESPARSRWSPISMRLPLFNPQSFLRSTRDIFTPLFSRPAAIVWLLLVLSAAASVVVRFDDFIDRFPDAAIWSTPSTIFAGLAVLFVCKLIHELAHAVTAAHYGVRVEECGVLFFLFMPCFYCNVSDAWRLDSALKRMHISAAGALVELTLAALATWAWWFSHPGPLQMICLTVMITCSINTLLINGNPLMKFDGYFIFIDAIGIPNLASRAAEWWSAIRERLVWGLPVSPPRGREGVIAAVYGAASLVYRLIVVVGMLWAIHLAAKARGLQAVSLVLAAMVLGGMAWQWGKSFLRPLYDPLMRRLARPARIALAAVCFGLLLLAAFAIPLPRSVDADFVVEWTTPVSVYVRSPGQLVSLRHAGSLVAAGEIIAELRNLPLERSVLELQTQRLGLERELASVRLLSGVNAALGERIPELQQALAAVDERLRLAHKELAELKIVAPCAGTLREPPNLPPRPVERHSVTSWSGTPFDRQNEHCFLERGTLLAQLTPGGEVCANAVVSQREIQKLKVEQQVTLAVHGGAFWPKRGRILEISTAPMETAPRELISKSLIPLRAGSNQALQVPAEPYYRVRIAIEGDQNLPAGSVGLARLQIEPASAAKQGLDLIADAFRFQL